MEIVRFDAETSIPIADFGSQFRLGPLTADRAQVRVSVLHVPAGGMVGAHDAASLQLLAVVAGSGWASGADGRRRTLRAGYGAVFEAGERHEAGSDDGLTAVCVEGAFEVAATRVTGEIVVIDPDPAWTEWFAAVEAYVWPAVHDVALRVEHVGSTSVPGLAAKPIIDTDVVVFSEADVRPAIDRLASIGYRWRGDLGVTGREAFHPPEGVVLPRHHLYLVVEDSKAHVDHWLLREVLAADPEARDAYAELKRTNQELAAGDMDVYVAKKAAFVAELLTRARAERGLQAEAYWLPELEDS